MSNAPIILFIYNRPWHTQQTIEALAANKGAEDAFLYVFADKVHDTLKYVNTLHAKYSAEPVYVNNINRWVIQKASCW